ncbi:hypothetical protein CTI12_AA178260 [Artemisia annua]|uniref:NB-ARC domains-containing protein n=1 Tax=Artemisia annua TaxID=35608 RepID=A0A2U1P9Q8_ARTAN|nr:hypothetical protein CTI12_AA178260 [Artemisia annua]
MKGGHTPIEDNVKNLEVKNVELQAKIETESNQARNDETFLIVCRGSKLSGTSLKRLPYSISKLKSLEKFILRDCDLLKELPPEIGDLENLKFGGLTRLVSLTFSLSVIADRHKRSELIVPDKELSKMIPLKEINIVVDYTCKWWEEEVESVIEILPLLPNLESLRLFLPTLYLLDVFSAKCNSKGVPICQQLNNFHLIVGDIEQRLIPDISKDLDKAFFKLQRVLTPQVYKGRGGGHGSDFESARACLCTLHGPQLGSPVFVYLWACTYGESKILTLALHTCPELKTVFTEDMIDRLTCLENLVLEDCRTLNNLLVCSRRLNHCLPSLKRMSLVHLPQLVGLFHGLVTAPRLESLLISNCPKLNTLSSKEVPDHIKEVKAEREWWDGLIWSEPGGRPSNSNSIFTQIAIKDINDG